MRSILFCILLNLIFISISRSQSYSLTDCFNYAIQHHPQIQNAATTINVAQIQQEVTKKQAFPTVTGGFSQTGSLGRNIDPFTNGIVTRGINFNSLNINAFVPIYNGFKQRYDNAKKTFETKSAIIEKEEWVFNKKTEIIQKFYTVLLLQESIKLKKNQIKEIENQLLSVTALISEGQLPRTTSDEINTQLLIEKSSLLQIENDYANEILSLETAIFWKEGSELSIESFRVSNENSNSFASFINVQQHPTYLRNQNLLTISKYNAKIAQTQFKPSVNFSANLGTTYSSAAPDEFTLVRQLNTNFGQFIGLTANFPLYTKGQKPLVVKINELQVKVAENQVRQSKFELEQQITKNQNDLKLAKERVLLLQKQLVLSQSVYFAAKEKHKEGLMSFIELNQWQNKYYNAVLDIKIETIKAELIKHIIGLFM